MADRRAVICDLCAFSNPAGSARCQACRASLAAHAQHPSSQLVAVAEHPHEVAFETRLAVAESRLAILAQHIAAAEAERAVIAESLALARGARSTREPPLTGPRQTLDVGPFQALFGGPAGTDVKRIGTRSTPEKIMSQAVQTSAAPPPPNVRGDADAAIWTALAQGTRLVRLPGDPGSGATTLLLRLAAGARDHDFPDGALFLTDVCGPVLDVVQRLAALVTVEAGSRYYSPAQLPPLFGALRGLVLLDRAKLTTAEQAELAGLFARLQFVIVDLHAPASAITVRLGALTSDASLTLLETGYGQPIGDEERLAALKACTTIEGSPALIRLVGVAAAQLGRSFAALLAEFGSGGAIIAAFMARLTPDEQRILGIVALGRGVVGNAAIATIFDNRPVGHILDRLTVGGLIHAGGERYVVARCIASRLPALVDADSVLERILDVLCRALDAPATVSIEVLVAAELLVQTAFERSQWSQVLTVGTRLAGALARRGAFGAWGRVLNLLAAAAKRANDVAKHDFARHELGARSLLLGENNKAFLCLRSALSGREEAGDVAGAAVTRGLLTLAQANEPSPEPVANAGRRSVERPAGTSSARSPLSPAGLPLAPADLPRRRSARSRRTGEATTNGWPPGRWRLLAGLAVAIFAALTVWLVRRPPAPPEIVDFSSDRATITAGSTAELCVKARNAAIVQITPDAGSVNSGGQHCTIVAPAVTTTYTAIATGAEGQEARHSVTVAVRDERSAPAPTITSFSAEPMHVRAGQSTRLCYAVTDANSLRITPAIGTVWRLKACRTVTPTRQTSLYKLVAIGSNGRIAQRRAQVEIIAAPVATATAAPSPVATATPARIAVVTPVRAATLTAAALPQAALARRAVYQFDATPARLTRGQTASLCVGIGRWSRGFVTGIGTLIPGLTRCYRVRPTATTVYRLHVALNRSAAVESLRIDVRQPSGAHQIAHTHR